MNHLLLIPPVTFLVVFALVWAKYRAMSMLKGDETWPDRPGRDLPYACGENIKTHHVQPDYSQFFPFAFFFTIMHVTALMAATVPGGSAAAAWCAAAYVIAAAVGLFILFRR